MITHFPFGGRGRTRRYRATGSHPSQSRSRARRWQGALPAAHSWPRRSPRRCRTWHAAIDMQRLNDAHELAERVGDDSILLDVVVRDVGLAVEQTAQLRDVVGLHRAEVGCNRPPHFFQMSWICARGHRDLRLLIAPIVFYCPQRPRQCGSYGVCLWKSRSLSLPTCAEALNMVVARRSSGWITPLMHSTPPRRLVSSCTKD